MAQIFVRQLAVWSSLYALRNGALVASYLRLHLVEFYLRSSRVVTGYNRCRGFKSFIKCRSVHFVEGSDCLKLVS
jgi:hypothetical protein